MRLMRTRLVQATFMKPTFVVRRNVFPRADWLYDLRLDGYRALAIKSYGVPICGLATTRASTFKYPSIVQALARLPDETVIDGEVVARDPD